MRIGLVITNARAGAAEVEAADRLALVRLDDDGAPCHSQPRSGFGRLYPHSDRGRAACRGSAAASYDHAGVQQRARRGRFSRPAPAACHRARTIAAAPGQARWQLTPALSGVG
jgi:hypothetical protein